MLVMSSEGHEWWNHGCNASVCTSVGRSHVSEYIREFLFFETLFFTELARGSVTSGRNTLPLCAVVRNELSKNTKVWRCKQLQMGGFLV